MSVRLALIGCGAIARRSHLPAFKRDEHADVVAFASRSIGSAEAARDEYGDGHASDDWSAVIEADDVDAVSICSPNALHHAQTMAAIKAGKHVLVEKPMATTLAEADEMVEAAGAAGVVLHVAHNMRYIPALIAMRDAMPKVGEISTVRAIFGHGGPAHWAPEATWFFDRTLAGGGAMLDLGIHAVEFLLHTTGLHVTDVAAMTYGSGDVEDAGDMVVRFDTDAIGLVHASWVTRPPLDFSLTVFGSEGTLHVDALTPPSFRAATAERSDLDQPVVSTDPYTDFVRAVRGEATPGPAQPATGADGRDALAVVCAAYTAAHTRTTVAL